MNADGYADIVTGASVGNPHVKVYDGKDIADGTFNPDGGSLLASWFAYGLNFNVGVNVAAGDINHDGYADVVTGSNVGNPHVKIYSGKDIATGNFAPDGVSLLASWFAYDAGKNLGAYVAVADANGIGVGHVITGATAISSAVGVYTFLETDKLVPVRLNQFFAYSLAFDTGVTVGAADIDGDGEAEILTGAAQGSPHWRFFKADASGEEPPALLEGFVAGIAGGITVGA